MKTKYLLVALLALLFSTNNAAAQNPYWEYLGNNIDTNDIYGNPVNLFDTLSAGKVVLLCFASTQDQESYALHQSGILEAVHNQLGDSICVIWVESDSSTNVADILGTGSQTLGNWTMGNNGNPVHYRLIDCPTCHVHCEHEESASELFFITPLHHFCEPLEEQYGFDINSDLDTVIARIHNLLSIYPRPGALPVVDLFGPTDLVADVYYRYHFRITSIDQLLDITWHFEDADPSTSTLSSPAVVWHTPGEYNVQLSVTNTTGTTVATLPVTVAAGWQWGDTISYCGDEPLIQSIGTNDTSFSWGMKIPNRYLLGRTMLTGTSLYVENPGHYTLNVYQGGEEAPETLVYSNEQFIATENAWADIPLQDNYLLDTTQSLWITYRSRDVSLPASYIYYMGDPNGSYCFVNNTWQSVMHVSSMVEATWMIKAFTSSAIIPPDTIPTTDTIPPVDTIPITDTTTLGVPTSPWAIGTQASSPAIFPNPAGDIIHIEIISQADESTHPSLITIFDSEGRTIKESTAFVQSCNSSSMGFAIPVNDLAPGIYI